jgi:hypothetical protein
MENESFPDDSPNESLADVPPTPVASAKGLSCGGLALGTAALAIAGTFVLISSQTTACRGSTRSSKLIFAARQAEIEQALRERQPGDAGDNRVEVAPGETRATQANFPPR